MTSDSSKHDYRKFLEDLHSKIIFPDNIFNSLIKKTTGSEIVKKEKLFKGETNQVFDVLTKNGQQVIVRISKQDKPMFAQEKWAMEKCKELGVPVADILLIEHLNLEDGHYSVCILNKLPGDTLERGSIDMNSMSESELKKIITQAGEILTKIHSIKTKEFGDIDGEGKGQSKSFKETLSEAIRKKEELLKLAKEQGFDTQVMEEIISTLDIRVKKFKNLEPRLNHGDFGPKHFMVNHGQITGILDFGETKSHSPVYDFAWWHYWFSDLSWSRDGKLFE